MVSRARGGLVGELITRSRRSLGHTWLATESSCANERARSVVFFSAHALRNRDYARDPARRYKHRGRVQRVQRSRSPWVMCSLGDVTPRKVSPPREPALSLDPRSILRTHAPVSFLSLALRLASRYCCAALCTPLRAVALHSFVGTYIGNRSNRKWRF